jgi:hypothetical protein
MTDLKILCGIRNIVKEAFEYMKNVSSIGKRNIKITLKVILREH